VLAIWPVFSCYDLCYACDCVLADKLIKAKVKLYLNTPGQIDEKFKLHDTIEYRITVQAGKRFNNRASMPELGEGQIIAQYENISRFNTL